MFAGLSRFVFDAEDYDTCRLNGQIKKVIILEGSRLPIHQ